MDKKRLAMRQANALKEQAERLQAIEDTIAQVLTAPADVAELAPTEQLATAAQIEALAAQVDLLLEKIDQIMQAMTAPASATPPPAKK